MNTAKKQRKTVEWERLEISSRNWRNQEGLFHATMGKIKDRNSKDLTEAEEIKKSWQEYTEKLYRKGLIDLDNHYSVATHLKPDILKYGVK